MARKQATHGQPAVYNATPPTLNDDDSSALNVDASGNLKVVSAATGASANQTQGTAADGAAAVGNPVQVAGKDGSGNVQAVATDTFGNVKTSMAANTASVTSVNDSATSAQLLAANTARVRAYVQNDSTVNLFIKLGGTATTTDYSIKLLPDDIADIQYTGAIHGIWASDASGAAKITELTNA